MKKTTIYLSDDILAELKVVSQSEGRSRAEIIREAVDAYLEPRRSALPSIFGKGTGGKIRAADSEDWLSENWQPN